MTPAEIVAKLDEYEKEVPPQTKGPRGAPVKPRTIARERLAKELGIAPGSVRKAEWHHLHPHKPENAVIRGPIIQTLGLDLAQDFVAQVAKAQEYLDAADKHLRGAQGALTRMASDAKVVFPAGRLQRLQEDTRELAGKVRGARPVSLCPWCKGQDGIQAECSACLGTGFITQSQSGSVPKELLDESTIRVARQGEIVELGILEGVIETPSGAIGMKIVEDDPWGLGAE